MRLGAFLTALLLVGLAPNGPAFAQSLTIQGRVATSANAPITGSAVQFRVQIRSPDASNCVLFDETHVLDLSTTNGLFSVNLNDGLGTVNTPTTYGLEAAISNRAAFSINSTYCASGTGVVTYTPNADDNRKVIIQFYDPSSMSGFESIPELDLNPMAFAMESRTVGGYPATSMLRVDTAGIPGAAPAYTVGEAAELKLLANGTSAKYTPASSTNGAQIPSFASDPSSPPAGSIWYNSTSGELHYRTSGGTQVVGAGGGGGGTITSISVSGGLSGGGSSGAVSVGLPSGTGGQVLRYNGSAWAGYSYGLSDLLSASLGSAVGSAACTAGQTMYYDSTAKELKCQSIGLANADVAGTLGVAHGGTGLTTGTVGAIPYFSSTSALSLLAAGSNGDVLTMNGAGLPVWQSLPAASFSGSGTVNRIAKFTGTSAVGNSVLTDDGTNVGVGTTAPIAKLEVAGSLRLADGGESCSAGANVGLMKYSGGSLFFCNASGWQTLGVSGAGLTSLNGLTTNTQTFAIGSAGTAPAWSSAGSVHTLNLPTASASNSGVLSNTDWSSFNGKLDGTATFAGDVTGTYNANVVTKLRGVAIGTTAPAAGQALKYIGSAWIPANLGFGDLKTTGGAATMASAVCNSGQTMYYDSTTGDLKCQSIAIDNASVTGTLPIANGGTGASSTSQNYVFAGPTSGSGAPSFRQLTIADISGLNTYWTSATGGINYAGGNVGIGTSAPTHLLHLRNTMTATGSPFLAVDAATGYGVSLDANWPGINFNQAHDGTNYVAVGSGYAGSIGVNPANGNMNFSTKNNPGAGNVVTGSVMMVLSNGGNLGIGSTTPSSKLDVAGTLRIADGGETCSGGNNVGMMKYNGGSLFFCNASGWQTLGVSGAGLTSLNGLTGNTQAFAIGSAGTSPAWSSSGTTHTLNLPTASASNSGVLSSSDWSTFNGKLGASAIFAGDVTGTYNANVVTKIQGVAVGTTAPTSGQFLKFSTAWNPATLSFGDIKTNGGAATLSSAACNAGQTMYYDSSTGDLKCQAIAVDNASVTGTLPVSHGGTGATSTSQNYVFAGPTSGSGAPTFRQLTAGDLPASASYWSSATGGINYSGGNVGIGSASPNNKLDLVGGNMSLSNNTVGSALNGAAFAVQNGGGGDAIFTWLISGKRWYSGIDASDAGKWKLGYTTGIPSFASDTRMTIDLAGNLGIGTTAPGSLLDVSGGGIIRVVSSGVDPVRPSTGKGLEMEYEQTFDRGNIRAYDRAGGIYKPLTIYGSTLVLNGSAATGNVGIGTSTPNAKLSLSATGNELVGTAMSGAFRSNGGSVGTTAGNQAVLASIGGLVDSNNVALGIRAVRTTAGTGGWGQASVGISYDVDNTAQAGGSLWINANGNVGIGSTSPGQKLSVSGIVESTSGGVKFPDGTTQTSASAAISSDPTFQAARAYSTASDFPNMGSRMIFPSVSINIGNGYNASTGVFTAPIAGYYSFSFTVSAGVDSTHNVNDIEFAKNGTTGDETISPPAVLYNSSTSTIWSTGSVTAVYLMAVGDTMQVVRSCCDNTQPTAYRSSFSGHYLHR